MDIKLSYIEKGKGENLILLHGNGENGEYFSNQIEYFSQRYRVVAVDTRGHGKSERGDAPFTIKQFADDLNCFMHEHNIDSAHLLGFSDGANIALVFALNYPQKIKKLVLNGANLNAKGIKFSTQIFIEIRYKLALLAAKKSDKAKRNAEFLALMVNEPNVEIKRLNEITAKTLVIAGTHDMIKTKHTKLIAEKIPNSKLIFIKGNHFIANKKPKQFNKAVEIFLDERL